MSSHPEGHDRKILALHDFERLSNGESAQVLGLSKTAKQLLCPPRGGSLTG
jgi:hypothetical protein